jgi:hypothetical protein
MQPLAKVLVRAGAAAPDGNSAKRALVQHRMERATPPCSVGGDKICPIQDTNPAREDAIKAQQMTRPSASVLTPL